MNNEKEEAFGKAIGRLVHDIRNYLNTIIGYSSIIQNNIKSDDKNYLYFNKIYNSGMMIENLLTNVDDFVSNSIDIDKNNIDINKEIKRFYESKQDTLNDKKIKILNLSEDSLYLDTSKNILYKIVDSFLYFSIKGLRNIEKRNIYYKIYKNDNKLFFLYSDNSNPIDIAGSYFTLDEILADKRGLGLLFIKKYVNILNGRIKYLNNNNWNEIKDSLNIDTNTRHGFIINLSK